MKTLPSFRQLLWVVIVITVLIFIPEVRNKGTAGAWYVSPSGSESNASRSPTILQYLIEHTLKTGFDLATSAYASDVDGDGDMDILGAAYGSGLVT